MINFGLVKPGSTLYIPFDSFAGSTGASITLTGLAVTDLEIYKDGSTTQRASDAGYTLLDTDGIDFDGITGIHGFSINLADNTTAGFYAAGSDYFLVVSAVTIDSQTVSFVAARWTIGYPDAILNTTIATLASQTSFTLTAGSADDSAYVGCPVVVHDVASAIQVCVGYVSAYTGASKTVTLAADPAIFTMATTDSISIFMPVNIRAVAGLVTNGTNLGSACANYSATRGLTGTAVPAAAADAAGGLPISDAGGLDLDAQIGADIDAILVDTGTTLDGRIPAALVGGRMDANVGAISSDATAADNAEAFFDGTGYAGTGNVIPTVTTLTGHTPQTGDNFARLGAPAGASISADIAAIEAQTDDIGAAGAGLTAVPWNAAWDAEVQSEVEDALDVQLADSVPADGTRATLRQAIYQIVQFLTDRSVSGTTVTVKKVDGTTTLFTCTLNDGTSPTSITRS